jgi:hypothetical protein
MEIGDITKKKNNKKFLFLIPAILLIGFFSFTMFDYYSFKEKINLEDSVVIDQNGTEYSVSSEYIVDENGSTYLISPDGNKLLLQKGLGNKRFRIYNNTGEVMGLDHYGNIQGIGNATFISSPNGGYGYFNYLGDLTTRITKLFVWNIDALGNLTVAGKSNFSDDVNITGDLFINNVNNTAPDFVFEENYVLKTLKEVEDFTKENKHLPWIKSAEELKNSGINAVDFNFDLLESIENLWLHSFEQEKKIVSQNEIINSLQNKLNTICKENNLKGC